jgi:hypothetical protein
LKGNLALIFDHPFERPNSQNAQLNAGLKSDIINESEIEVSKLCIEVLKPNGSWEYFFNYIHLKIFNLMQG